MFYHVVLSRFYCRPSSSEYIVTFNSCTVAAEEEISSFVVHKPWKFSEPVIFYISVLSCWFVWLFSPGQWFVGVLNIICKKKIKFKKESILSISTLTTSVPASNHVYGMSNYTIAELLVRYVGNKITN